MIAAVDVDYRQTATGEVALAAAVVFDRWEADASLAEHVARLSDVAPYEPGRFAARELRPLLAVIRGLAPPLDAVVVDGYVWLGPERPGLGAHLHFALDTKVPVVGVAKRPFRGAPALEVLRGASARPLYVTAIGIDAAHAADGVRRMHGAHRIPTLLTRVDRLCRDTPFSV